MKRHNWLFKQIGDSSVAHVHGPIESKSGKSCICQDSAILHSQYTGHWAGISTQSFLDK